jgi:hypothetical protein
MRIEEGVKSNKSKEKERESRGKQRREKERKHKDISVSKRGQERMLTKEVKLGTESSKYLV